METRRYNAPDAPKPAGGYAQAVEIVGAARLLFVSGQVGLSVDGALADGFEAQCRQVWANLEAQLRGGGMTLDHIVKITTYLADRAHAVTARAVRQSVMGSRMPASTLVVAGLFDAGWLVEIEVVAAA